MRNAFSRWGLRPHDDKLPGRARWLALGSSLILAGAASYGAGCGTDADNCALALTCPGYADGGSGSDAGMDAPVNPACVGDPMSKDAGPLSECGVFASPTAPAGGDGSKGMPLAKLQDAIDKAATTGVPVFACGKEFAENVHVPAGVTLYGALDCDNGWVWTGGKRTTIKPPAKNTDPGGSEIALKLGAGKGTVIEDVDVVAPDGVQPGTSSIAVLADGATAQLTRCALTAGNGAPGGTGADGNATDLDGMSASPGVDICSTGANSPGAAGVSKTCLTTGGQSIGGNGGDGGSPGGTPAPGSGTNGSPTSATLGQGGAGEGTLACVAGTDGAPGGDGSPGLGADTKMLGAISASGFNGTPGKDGKDGTPGQGGGGGGGAKGAAVVVCMGVTVSRFGASGGAGATGSCGGQHGGGGSAGGSSLALVSLGATLTLANVDLTAQNGGAGGAGGKGQSGGALGKHGFGGSGAGGGNHACDGGYGGKGGYGGPGGGGMGGHSIGIAFTGKAPAGAKIKVAATGGAGGPGGMGNMVTGGMGAGGVVAQVQPFN